MEHDASEWDVDAGFGSISEWAQVNVTTSDLSSGHPLCKFEIPARLRNSWTTSNPAKKWYGCNNYKKAGDCDFFEWADKEMSAYEKRLAQHLKEMEERRQADNDKVEELIEKKCKKQLAQHLKEME
ncbi:uncharacterized protein LOC133871982 isoform X2 [Alnus glutinosa]|uniref:uncharacterized protein LOC133871982 isoform X2 n=1 Tax=Alnus glutinosa TaxID=3517 RepID=UPI002D78A457|nr:uncharacterized protein LOC133871982 isoform X2 [Alnus glutinosa]